MKLRMARVLTLKAVAPSKGWGRCCDDAPG